MPKKSKVPPSDSQPSATEFKVEQAPARRAPQGRKPVRKKTSTPKTRASKSEATRRSADASDEQIRTRAYFIAERRHRLGLPGDASSDWLEAKRQLLAELGPR
jgi:Protein of unknown function (DUF2934)